MTFNFSDPSDPSDPNVPIEMILDFLCSLYLKQRNLGEESSSNMLPLPRPPGQDPYSLEIPEEVRKYACYALLQLCKSICQPKNHTGDVHTRNNVGMQAAFIMDRLMCWREWMREVPFIKFDADWEIKVIPPFGGAVSRFFVKKGDKQVSVYLDCYDVLGSFGEPYWEIYPSIDDDAKRICMNDIEGLLEIIRCSLEKKEEANKNED